MVLVYNTGYFTANPLYTYLGNGWVYYNYTKLGSDSFSISSNMTKDNKLYYFICGTGGDGGEGISNNTNQGGNPGAYFNNFIDLSANTFTSFNTSIKNNPCGGIESSITYPTTYTANPVVKLGSAKNGSTGVSVDASNITLQFYDNLSNNAIFIGGTGGSGGSNSVKTGFSGNGGGGGGAGDGSHHMGIGGKGTNGHSGGDSTRNSLGEYSNGGGGGAAFKFSEGGIGGGGGGGGYGKGGSGGYTNNGNGGAGGTGAIMFYYQKA
jgi:hypothetical protein